ncbi:hypothetical protein K1X13_08345 [Nocardioides sp. WL0053]|uniref:Uncharacterized protein n=1 Tax=Nocardioides jiangsuensis TaxID=2866161 RepID=A0ABS7RMT0_9ACTN|nr:hypothetical protein [Nocardioides jiangsuensis]MBY9074827.1 hypothetical protein [Nocardioides jiangsuensis]
MNVNDTTVGDSAADAGAAVADIPASSSAPVRAATLHVRSNPSFPIIRPFEMKYPITLSPQVNASDQPRQAPGLMNESRTKSIRKAFRYLPELIPKRAFIYGSADKINQK